MTGSTGAVERAPRSVPLRTSSWLTQLGGAALFYLVYARVRDWHGTAAADDVAVAQRHGLDVLHLERGLHLDVELPIQRAALHWTGLVRLLDVFYGSFHFVATCAVFVGLLGWAPAAVFRRARNILALTTAAALVVFALYPTMPPRMMPPAYRYQDTMVTVGGLWSYNRGVLERISDPFAAMPSLHIAWAVWCVVAVWPVVHRLTLRVLLACYPLITCVAVLVTGTHWLLDLVAGAALLAIVTVGLELLARRRAPQSRDVRVAERDKGVPGHHGDARTKGNALPLSVGDQ